MKLSRVIIVAAVALCLAGTGSAFAQDLFPQAASANDLRRADGLIWDATVDDPDPHWVFDGEFILLCRAATSCATASLANIDFDLSLSMVRPDGTESHSHNFTDFVASGVTVTGDDLIIDGMITFQTSPSPVIITIEEVADRATFVLELVGNGHIVGPISGVVVRSR